MDDYLSGIIHICPSIYCQKISLRSHLYGRDNSAFNILQVPLHFVILLGDVSHNSNGFQPIESWKFPVSNKNIWKGIISFNNVQFCC